MKYITLIVALLISANVQADIYDHFDEWTMVEYCTMLEKDLVSIYERKAYLKTLEKSLLADTTSTDFSREQEWNRIKEMYADIDADRASYAKEWSQLSCALIIYGKDE